MELGTPRHALSSRWDTKFCHSVGWVLDEHDEYCMTLRRSESDTDLQFHFMMLLYVKDSFRKSAFLAIVAFDCNTLLDQQRFLL